MKRNRLTTNGTGRPLQASHPARHPLAAGRALPNRAR